MQLKREYVRWVSFFNYPWKTFYIIQQYFHLPSPSKPADRARQNNSLCWLCLTHNFVERNGVSRFWTEKSFNEWLSCHFPWMTNLAARLRIYSGISANKAGQSAVGLTVDTIIAPIFCSQRRNKPNKPKLIHKNPGAHLFKSLFFMYFEVKKNFAMVSVTESCLDISVKFIAERSCRYCIVRWPSMNIVFVSQRNKYSRVAVQSKCLTDDPAQQQKPRKSKNQAG